MADEQAPQQDQTGAYFADLERKLGGAFNALQQRIGGIEQKVEQVGRGAAPTPPPQPADLDEKILKELFENPRRFLAEWSQINQTQANNIAEQKVQALIQQQQTEQQWGNFWQGFWQHNGDLAPMSPMVYDAFARSQQVDPMGKAAEAAQYTRQLMASMQANALEQEKRKADQARLAASPVGSTPGFFPQMNNPTSADVSSYAEEKQQAVVERMQDRRKKLERYWAT